MKKTALVFCITMLLFGVGSCKKNPIEPPDEEQENLTPGRRDYTWTVDTIKNYTLHLYSIWGKTPNDVFTVGPYSGDQIWRFNGEKWYPEKRVFIPDPFVIYYYNDKMWICSDWGQIWKYENNIYTKELDIKLTPNWPVSFYSIDGRSDVEIYAVAAESPAEKKDGLFFRYDGITWSLFKKFENIGIINFIKYSSKNDKYYCNSVLTDEGGNSTERVYEFDRDKLKMLNEHAMTSEMMSAINTIRGYIYITLGNKIYCYANGTMELMFEINKPYFGGQLWGRNRNDILIRMYDGVAHYNGTDIQYLIKFPNDNRLSTNAMIFEKEVFIPAKDYNTGYSLIYHGVLK
jgi:hypothetical protein